MQYIIIGAGPAGIVAAETIRKNNQKADITIIGDESEPPYSRMAIPYILDGKIEEQGSYLRDTNAFLADNSISLLKNIVIGIDTEAQKLSLLNDASMDYDKLLIATGSSPIRPPIPGIDSDLVQSCWTLEDARNIATLAQPGSNVVLVGAGFIGCIILESLVKRGVNLTVIESGNRMVPRMMNDKAGGLLLRWCQNKGINVMTSCSVDSISENSGTARVQLNNGSEITADLIITATGVKPNFSFLKESNIKIDRGIIVNEYLQTSDSNIYAAGDVAQSIDFSTGNHEVHAIQPAATDQGRVAALNMVGKQVQHHGSMHMNVLDTLGLISNSFGLWMGVEGGDGVEIYNEKDYRYLNIQFMNDIVIGASSTGMTQHVGVLRGLIESKISLGPWKEKLMKDPTLIMEAYIACTQEIGL